jgi:hypothetical protein
MTRQKQIITDNVLKNSRLAVEMVVQKEQMEKEIRKKIYLDLIFDLFEKIRLEE